MYLWTEISTKLKCHSASTKIAESFILFSYFNFSITKLHQSIRENRFSFQCFILSLVRDIHKIKISETSWLNKAKSNLEPLAWLGRMKLYTHVSGPDHMTKFATMSIFGENHLLQSQIFFILTLGMEHRVLKVYKVFIL